MLKRGITEKYKEKLEQKKAKDNRKMLKMLKAARDCISGLNKADFAEIRVMNSPPAAI